MNLIYAKSIANPGQLNIRHEWFQQKEQLVDGVEVLLLGRDFKDLKATERILLEAKKKFNRIALEAPDCIEKGGIDPVSGDAGIRTYSREFLDAFARLADEVGADYAQYQLMRPKFGEEGMPPAESLKTSIDELAKYHIELQSGASALLQIENTIPLNPSGHADKISELHYEPNTTRMTDFELMEIPAAYDTAHAMSAVYAYFKAAHADHLDGDHTIIHKGVKLHPVKTEIGTCHIRLDQHDWLLACEVSTLHTAGTKLGDALTKTLIADLEHYGKSGLIRSVQLQNAINFGISKGDHGRLEGWLDLEKICKAIPKEVPIIPEVTETDYLKPENQKTLLHRMHEWLKTA